MPINLTAKSLLRLFTALALISTPLLANKITIVQGDTENRAEKTAAAELQRFLQAAYPDDSFSIEEQIPQSGKYILLGTHKSQPEISDHINKEALNATGSYIVKNTEDSNVGIIAGNHSRAVLDGVYALLEQLGYAFYLEHNIHPDPITIPFSFNQWNLRDTPIVEERFILNWHNFLSGCTGWNLEHYRKWIRQASRMGYNSIMLHFYGNNPAFQYTHNGETKDVGFMGATHKGPEWGIPLLNDVRRLPGANFLEHPVYSSEVALVEDDQRVDAAVKLIQQALQYAESFGIKIHLAVDMDHYSCNPQNIIQTLPESARFKNGQLARPDRPEGYAYYKTQVKTLLETYPQLNTIIVWSRGEWTDWMTLKYEDLPKDWQAEYDAIKEAYPTLDTMHPIYKNDKGPAHFAYSKITQVFLSILTDLEREDVKIGYGGWWDRTGQELWRLHNLTEDPAVSLWVKDYSRDFRWPDKREIYSEISQKRKIYPIDWAHHDDGKYAGRPYRPHENFSDMLESSGVHGYGVVHWMTWPLDIFFKNIIRQTWASSRNESHETTSDIMAGHFFGEESKEAMGAYLKDWWVNAPSFGYATSPNYMNTRTRKEGPVIPNVLKDAAQHLPSSLERIRRLEKIDISRMSADAVKFHQYFLLNEKFIAGIADSSLKLMEAKEQMENGEIQAARSIMESSRHTETVKTFAQAAKAIGPSRGESGHLVRIASVWLYSYDYLCAQLGLQPIGYNFGPIPIDKFAIGAVNQKFHFDRDGYRWAVHDAPLIQNGGQILRTKSSGIIGSDGQAIDVDLSGFSAVAINDLPPATSSDEEIAHTYVERDSAITLQLKAVIEDLVPGTYHLDLYFPASLSKAKGERMIQINFQEENREVDLYNQGSILKKVHFPNILIEEPVLAIRLEGTKGNPVISGAKLMHIKDL